MADQPSTLAALKAAATSWRLGAVCLLSFSSGLPLSLVLKTGPYWLSERGIDIKTIGLITAAQAPYAFKFLWSPLMDRFAPSGSRKRFWIALGQVGLVASILGLAWLARTPVESATGVFIAVAAALLLLVAFSSATQDIAVDAYAVEALRPSEHGLAVGARTAVYRAAMWVVGGLLLSLSAALGWPLVFAVLAASFVPLVAVTVFAPEPENAPTAPRSLREAAWDPFVSFFRVNRALEITAFLFLYKLGDNLAGALVAPFLNEAEFTAFDIGVATSTIGLVATLLGTFVGGVMTSAIGVGRSLWIFGLLQAVSNIGYVAVAEVGPNRPVMYLAMGIESLTSGMGTGAFSVLLLRMTSRRFSATQYALFSSLFALSRTVSGPPAGLLVDAVGWQNFFLFTIPLALPGLWMLRRFVPITARDVPELGQDEKSDARREAGVPTGGLLVRSLTGALAATAGAFLFVAMFGALRLARKTGGRVELLEAFRRIFSPDRAVDYLDLVGPPVFGLVVGLAVAAYFVARASPPSGR